MKKVLILVAFMTFISGAAHADILTIFSDKGIPAGDTLFTWNGSGITQSSIAVPPSTLAPEGLYTLKTNGPTFTGWGVFYPPTGVDLTHYQSGELRFWIYTNTDNLTLSFEHANVPSANNPNIDCFSGRKDCFTLQGQIPLNQWVMASLKFNDAAVFLNSIYSPFQITANVGATFYIDDVRYVDSTGAPIFAATIKNISDQGTTNVLTWNTVAPSGWLRANQYIQLDVDPYDMATWGAQIYTNNRSVGAAPAFVRPTGVNPGDPGSNPAGLIDIDNHSVRIPLAWSIKSSSQAPSAAAPIPADPNNTSDLHSFQWLYMKDAQTPAILSEGTTVFQNGDVDPFVLVKSNVGIHFGQQNSEIGAEDSPNYIFLEANYGAGLAQQTYSTNRLILEFFQE